MAVPAPMARAAWSAPATVSVPHSAIGGLQLLPGPADSLLAWDHNDLVAPRYEIFGPNGSSYVVAAAGGSFGPERPLPNGYAAASGQLVDLGGGRVAQLLFVTRGRSVTSTAEIALGRTDGRFGAPQRVEASVWNDSASLAGDARGDLVLAWLTSNRATHRQVWASVQPAGGHFGAPQLLSSTADPLRVRAAVGANGDAVVAFASKRMRLLATVRRHARSWGPLQDVGPGANYVSPLITGNGRVVIAWSFQVLSEGGPLGPGSNLVAVQPSGALRFRADQRLERNTNWDVGVASPAVVAGAGGRVTVAFLAQGAAPVPGPTLPTVVEATSSTGVSFAAPRTVSPVAEQASDVAAATGPTGAIISWVRQAPFDVGTVFAALGNPGTGRFGAPEQVSPAGDDAITAVPAFDTGANRWLLAWAGRPLVQTQTVVQVSTGS